MELSKDYEGLVSQIVKTQGLSTFYECIGELKERIAQDKQKIEELEKRIKRLTTPWGYSSEDDSYADPYDYIDGQLYQGSKVGDEFSLTPYVLLPERTFRLTKLDDETGSFEYEVLEDNKQ